ncbi:hypothetical protein PBRA_007657 [Plasmodiophora brassicae]|uniref:BED-type domain-containing protein n=1 Tax=Plasmodiophora brassicae TaxID=37360 RepID=A0A0G4IX42_PLABS|nr:hypothetical protein PBRA_007657 [Plasmodiophora brassicae]
MSSCADEDGDVVVVDEANGETQPQSDVEARAPKSDVEARAPKSDVWAHIEEFDERGSVKWRCKHCTVAKTSKVWNTKNTFTFREHLKRKHPGFYQPDARQTKLTDGFVMSKRKEVDRLKIDRARVDQINTNLLGFIINASQAFSVVEQEDFVEFCASMEPGYTLPSRTTVRDVWVLERWWQTRDRVRAIVNSATKDRRCSITTDMRTSAAKRGYMAITLHYLNDEWEMVSIVIGFVRVLYPHTADRLAAALFRSIFEFSPDLLKSIWTITTDNASTNPAMAAEYNNMLIDYLSMRNDDANGETADDEALDVFLDASLDYDDESTRVSLVRRFAHVLQVAIKDGLQKVTPVDMAIGRIRDTVKKITDSPKLLEAFQDICTELNVMSTDPVLDCETRWNSTFDMLKSAIRLRRPIEELLKRIRESRNGYTKFTINPRDTLAKAIGDITWNPIRDLCDFLEPFKDATELITLMEHVHVTIDAQTGFRSQHAKKFATVVKDKLIAYQSLVLSDHALVASILDPRSKSSLEECGVDIAALKASVITLYEARYRHKFEGDLSHGTKASEDPPRKKSKLFEKFIKSTSSATAVGSTTEPFQSELERWMTHPSMCLSKSSRDACLWFKVNGHMYPRISLMARDYLSVMSTGVKSC